MTSKAKEKNNFGLQSPILNFIKILKFVQRALFKRVKRQTIERGRKYLQTVYLIRDKYLEYTIKNFYNSTTKLTTQLKNRQRLK